MQANKSALRAPRALCCLTLSNPIRMAALALVEWKYPVACLYQQSSFWSWWVHVFIHAVVVWRCFYSLNCKPQALWYFHPTRHLCQLRGHGRHQAVSRRRLQRHQSPAGELLFTHSICQIVSDTIKYEVENLKNMNNTKMHNSSNWSSEIQQTVAGIFWETLYLGKYFTEDEAQTSIERVMYHMEVNNHHVIIYSRKMYKPTYWKILLHFTSSVTHNLYSPQEWWTFVSDWIRTGSLNEAEHQVHNNHRTQIIHHKNMDTMKNLIKYEFNQGIKELEKIRYSRLFISTFNFSFVHAHRQWHRDKYMLDVRISHEVESSNRCRHSDQSHRAAEGFEILHFI